MISFRSSISVFAIVCFMAGLIEKIHCSGSTDSSTIRGIESEVKRVKATSDNIFGELKKQKDTTTALQNEFKWLHNEFKGFKKSLADIELLLNQTVRNDTEFIREKITELSNFIFNVGKIKSSAPATGGVTVKPTNTTNTTNLNANTTLTTTPLPGTTTKKFKLF